MADLEKAREAGFTDEQILDRLATLHGADVEAARAKGFNNQQILERLAARPAPERKQPEPPDAARAEEAPAPQPEGTGFSLKQTLSEMGKQFKEHTLEPYAALWGKGEKTVPPVAFPIIWYNAAQYVMNNDVDERMQAAAEAGEDPIVARQQAIRDNATDMGLLAFDLGSIAVAGPVHAAARQSVARLGLRGTLQGIAANAAEGAGFLAAYEGIEGAIQGEAARQIGEDMLKGAGVGLGFGAGIGVAGAALSPLAKKFGPSVARAMGLKKTAEAAAEQSVAATEIFEGAKELIRESHPHLSSDALEYSARRIAFEGIPIEEVQRQLPSPLSKSGVSGKPVPEDAAYHEDPLAMFQRAAPDVADVTPTEATNRAWDEMMATAAMPEDLQRGIQIEQRGRNVPYHGLPSTKEVARAIEVNPMTLRDRIKATKNFFGKLFVSDPGVPPKMGRLFLGARRALEASDEISKLVVEERITDLFTGSFTARGLKTSRLSDLMFHLDQLATMRSLGKKKALGHTTEEWMDGAQRVANDVAQDPQVMQAHLSARQLANEMQEIAVQEGIMKPGQFREDYLPHQRLYALAGALADHMRGTEIGNELAAALKRTSADEIIKTNAVDVFQNSLRALFRHITERRVWHEIISTPEWNVTRFYRENPNLPIAKGYTVYYPKKGLPGYEAADALEELAAGAREGLPKDRWVEGGIVLPNEIVERLESFYGRTTSPLERNAYNVANFYSRQLTLYSPSNFSLNAQSDTPMAALGLPGEKMNLFGFIRALPEGLVESYRAAFGKKTPRARELRIQGITGSTFIQSLGGKTTTPGLEAALAAGEPRGGIAPGGPFREIRQVGRKIVGGIQRGAGLVRQVRTGLEGTPRAAAGIAAQRRAGQPATGAELGRIGRQATIDFGAGAPEITREPLMRLLAPFWKWNGGASARLFKLAMTKGSRGRALAGMILPSVAAAGWNLHNEAYRQAEWSLSEYDRTHLHIILPDPSDPSKPFITENGRVKIWRVRAWFPEEVAGFFGLGNIPARLVSVQQGLATPRELVEQTGSELAQNISSLPAILGTAKQTLTGQSSLHGKELENFERLESLTPGLYLAARVREAGENRGALAAMQEFGERIVGIREAGVQGTGDARTRELFFQLRNAVTQYKRAMKKRNFSRAERFHKMILERSARLAEHQQALGMQLEVPQEPEESDNE